MSSCWKAMTLACQSKQTSIAAIMTNETASVIASCDSDAGTCKRRRNLTRLPWVRKGNFPSMAEQSRCHCKHHSMWYLGASCGEQVPLEAQKNRSLSHPLVQKSTCRSPAAQNVQHRLIPA